jgi:very-short-patch-repair endonuclease
MLVDYLEALSKLRIRVVDDFNKYENAISLESDPHKTDDATNAGIYLEVSRPRGPILAQDNLFTTHDAGDAEQQKKEIYKRLFQIHQEQLKNSEEYELVLGVGLLQYREPNGNKFIRRHLVVSNAELSFDDHTGKFTVSEHESGANFRFEEEICNQIGINTKDYPEDGPWIGGIKGVLLAIANAIGANGEYREAYVPNIPPVTENPVILYAPTLIFRKRSTTRIIEILKKIRGRMAQNENSELFSLISGDGKPSGNPTDNANDNHAEGVEVFFPKPSNAEQYEIVAKMQRSKGVIVQGPPGTGKSHTVANLICHLLACGKKILVTAETQKALQVLDNLLPEDLRPLCVSMLGNGAEEKKSLERSVNNILNKDTPKPQEINKLTNKLSNLRSEKVKLENRLRAIRESETLPQTIAEGRYNGKAAEIAQTLERESAEYGWFPDPVPLDGSCPFSVKELQHVILALIHFTSEKRAELALKVPDNLPSSDDFAQWVVEEKDSEKREAEERERANEELVRILLCNPDAIENLANHLETFGRAHENLPVDQPWMRDAAREIATGSHSLWNDVSNKTEGIISSIQGRVEDAENTPVDIPEDKDIRSLYHDAQKLMEHIEEKGGLGWWPFQPSVVKERAYLLKSARIDGHRCKNLDDFTRLRDALQVRVELKKAQELWANKLAFAQLTYSQQLLILKSALESLKIILKIKKNIELCRDALNNFPGIPSPDWNTDVGELAASCRFAVAHSKKQEFVRKFLEIGSSVAQTIATGNAPLKTRSLKNAINNRDPVAYRDCEAFFCNFERDRQRLLKFDHYYSELEARFPILAHDMKNTCDAPIWEARITDIDKAWHWKQARSWIDDYVRKEDAQEIASDLKQTEEEIGKTISSLAACHAWRFCMERLDGTTKQNMIAWQNEMKKLGKGTGKYAARHRKNAQNYLNKCRDAVPAYVMPLYRVWDTVDPKPEIFDVIIVDEASQCSFDAIPLFYLAKQILIVGDDKQISPEDIGLQGNVIAGLLEQHLADHPFMSAFDLETSLFDHGNRLFGAHGNRVALREHFRCMPEIIRFSNENFYQDTPMIPLRQYNSDRLPPLLHHYVEGGSATGTDSNIINAREAETLVEKIAECCENEAYKEKTMGVIVLQGTAQARTIENLLLQRLGTEKIEKRRLICGNARSFQGDERDVMFLSLVVAGNKNFTSLTMGRYKKIFNVAASRARDQMMLFHSVRLGDLGANCLRRKLLEFFMNTAPRQIAGIPLNTLEKSAKDRRQIPQPFESWFEVDVALEICRKGYRVIPQYAVAGRRIDLVIEGGMARLAVECDGDQWHGPEQYNADMDRERQLERCGWTFFRVRASAFYADRQGALKDLWLMLAERGIFP